MSLTYDALRDAVAGEGVGIRARTELEPLGGPGDKVFPPTYAVSNDAEPRYAIERRRLPDGGTSVTSVVLDSVASQANRAELALLAAIRGGEARLPLTSADFRVFDDLVGYGRISDLEAPHRIFDAILRDSLHGEVLFRFGPVGRAVTEATPRNATALLHHAPAALVFGAWDSTGPRGGRGAKYERAWTSEIVAFDIEVGRKTSSRIDPLGIELKAVPVYETPDGDWTLDESEARREKGKPKKVKPSEVNHGNVAPSIDDRAGGVTAARIEATTVLSLIQLRRLGFPTSVDGALLSEDRRREAEVAARTALAALGVAAAVLAFDDGFDLRSRCVLVAKHPLRFDLMSRTGDARTFELDRAGALALLDTALDVSAAAGLPVRSDELLLRPTDRLAELVRRTRDHAIAVGEE